MSPQILAAWEMSQPNGSLGRLNMAVSKQSRSMPCRVTRRILRSMGIQ
jgi:hypothetical protein